MKVKYNHSIVFIMLFTALVAIKNTVYASEPMVFHNQISAKEELALRSFNPSLMDQYDFSKHDLNNDGTNDLIAKSRDCTPVNFCHYIVLGLGASGIRELHSIHAYALSVSNQSRFGVRDLFIADNQHNAFRQKPYVWNPEKSRYTLLDGDERS